MLLYAYGRAATYMELTWCRGDGACGKTSLLNVFTRGYTFLRPCAMWIPCADMCQVLSDCIVGSSKPISLTKSSVNLIARCSEPTVFGE